MPFIRFVFPGEDVAAYEGEILPEEDADLLVGDIISLRDTFWRVAGRYWKAPEESHYSHSCLVYLERPDRQHLAFFGPYEEPQ